MALSYRQVKDLYDTLKGAGATTLDLPEWSRQMDNSTNTDFYGAGLNDNILKRANVGIDRLIEMTGLPDLTESIGRDVGGWVGNAQAGADIGRSLPRQAVNFAPMLIPGAGWGAGLLRLGAMGALAGADTYTQTGSPAAGLLSAATNIAMPAVAGAAERAALRGLGVKAIEGSLSKVPLDELITRGGPVARVREYIPQTFGQGLISQGAGQLASAAFGEVSSAAQAGLDPNSEYSFSPTTTLLNMTLGQLPFAALYATKGGRAALGGEISRLHAEKLRKDIASTENVLNLRQAKEEANAQAPIETIPDVATGIIDPKVDAEINTRLSELRNKQLELVKEATPESTDLLRQSQQEEADLLAKHGMEPKDGKILGVTPEVQPTSTEPPNYFAHVDALNDVEREVNAATTTAEFQQAITKLNSVRESYGIAPLDDVKIANRRKMLDLVTAKAPTLQDTLQAETNSTRQAIATQQIVKDSKEKALVRSREFMAQNIEKANAGDATAKALDDLQKRFLDLGGRYSQIVDSGMFAVRAEKWLSEGGNLDTIETFKSQFGEAVKQGKGLEAKPKVLEVVKMDNEVAAPIKDLVAEDIMQEASYLDDFETKDEIAALVREGKLVEASKLLGGDNEAWLGERKFASPQGTRPTESAPFVPQTKYDKIWVAALGTNGTELYDYLTRSNVDPSIGMLMTDLGPRFKQLFQNVEVNHINGSSHAVALPGFKTKLNLSADLRLRSPKDADFEIVHELLHGLTVHELDNPTNKESVNALNKLRLSLVAKLPEHLRSAYDKAIKGGWYGKYSEGRVAWDSLYKARAEGDEGAQIVYGLLNNHELVSQGFTSREMQAFMRSHRSEAKQSFFHGFANWVSTLLGSTKVPSTMFEDFLGASDRVMRQGEYVATLQRYGERFFQNRGLTPERATAQSERAVAVINGRDLDHGLIVGVLAQQARESDVMKGLGETFEKEVSLGDESAQMTGQLFKELELEPNVDSLHEILINAIDGEVANAHLAFELLPDTAKQYIFAQSRDAQEVLSMAQAATSKEVRGLLNVTDADEVHNRINETIASLKDLSRYEQEHEQAVRELQSAMAISPPVRLLDTQTVLFAPKSELPVWTDATETKKSALDKFTSFLLKPATIAQTVPELAPMIAKGYQMQANARRMALEVFRVFGLDLKSGVTTEESVDAWHKSLKDSKVTRAVDEWIYLNNSRGGDEVKTLPITDPDVKKVLEQLTQAQQAEAIDLMNKRDASQIVRNQQALGAMTQIAAADGAALIARDTNLPMTQNRALSETMLGAVMSNFADPQAAQLADAQLRSVQAKMTPEAFLKLLKYSQSQAERINLYKTQFEANPGWASAKRQGKYTFQYRRGGEVLRGGANSRKEAEYYARGGEIISFERNVRVTDDTAPDLNFKDDKIFARLRELEDNQMQMLSNVLSPDDLAELRRTSPVEQFAFETRSGGSIPNLEARSRRLSKGARDLPWLSNHFSYLSQDANYWARQIFRSEARAATLDPTVAQDPKLQSWARQHATNILSSDPEFGKMVTRFTTSWLLGFNPASAIANGTQLFIRGAAQLTSITGKPIDSYRRITNAFAEMAAHHIQGKKWASEEHEWLIQRLTQDGEINLSRFDEEELANEAVAFKAKAAIAGQRPKSFGDWLGTLTGGIQSASMWMFRQLETVNNTGAALSAFDLYREQGLSRDEAYAKATEFNRFVNDTGGKVNRSVGLHSGKDSFTRSAAMVANSMQSYVLGATGQIIHYLKRGFFRPEGLTPHEVWAARKAGVQMLATQFAMAGTLGMPFVAGAISLLEKAFPELELNKHLRNLFSQVLGEDESGGHLLSDIAMTGIPSMLGWDFQSRLSMGTIPGVSEVNGFQPELLLGAPYNVASSFVKGGTQILGGNLAGVNEMLPPAFKKLTKLLPAVFGDGGQLRDNSGRPTIGLTPGETIGMALGFNPKRLSDFNAASQMAARTQKIVAAQEGRERQRLAQEVLKGNFGSVRQELLAKSQESPDYNPVESVRAIARAAEELTFPRDLRREGSDSTSSARSKLLSMFRIDPTQPSEVARLRFRQQVEAQLGLRASRDSEVQQALLMDQLKQTNPDATRSELRRAARVATRRQTSLQLLD